MFERAQEHQLTEVSFHA